MNLVRTIILVLAFSALSSGTTNIREDVGTFEVQISGAAGSTFNITTSGSATAGTDYEQPPSQQTLPIYITIFNDNENEEPETLIVYVETDAENFEFVYVIEDDDAVNIAASNTAFVEGENATINLTCVIPFGSVSFTFSVEAENGTAVSPDDYIYQTKTFTCTSMSPTVSVDIQLVQNSIYSSNKTFGLSVVSNFTVSGDTDLTVTILDDDEPTCTQPCQNGGTCVSGSCQCVSGYTGSFCESRDC